MGWGGHVYCPWALLGHFLAILGISGKNSVPYWPPREPSQQRKRYTTLRGGDRERVRERDRVRAREGGGSLFDENRRKVLSLVVLAWQPAGVGRAPDSAGGSGAVNATAPTGAQSKIIN